MGSNDNRIRSRLNDLEDACTASVQEGVGAHRKGDVLVAMTLFAAAGRYAREYIQHMRGRAA